MIERRQNLPLAHEALTHKSRIHPALDELDGDMLLELIVFAHSSINRPHPAVPDQPREAVRANAVSREIIVWLGAEADGRAGDGFWMKSSSGIARQQREHFATQFLIAATNPRQIGFALGNRTINNGAE